MQQWHKKSSSSWEHPSRSIHRSLDGCDGLSWCRRSSCRCSLSLCLFFSSTIAKRWFVRQKNSVQREKIKQKQTAERSTVGWTQSYSGLYSWSRSRHTESHSCNTCCTWAGSHHQAEKASEKRRPGNCNVGTKSAGEMKRRKKGRKRRRRRNSLVSGQRQQSYRRCTTAVSDWGRDWDWDLCVIAMQMRDAEMLQWQKLEMEEYEARMKKWRHCTNLVNMGNWVCWRCASVRAVLSLAELNLITIAGNTHTLFYWQIRSFARIVLFFFFVFF